MIPSGRVDQSVPGVTKVIGPATLVSVAWIVRKVSIGEIVVHVVVIRGVFPSLCDSGE